MQPDAIETWIAMATVQNAIFRVLALGGLAAALLAIPPASIVAAAAAEIACEPAGGDTLVHVVRPGDNLHLVAVEYRERAGWYNLTDCLQAIRAASYLPDGDRLQPGDSLHVPIMVKTPPPITGDPTRDGSDLRALYLPGMTCSQSTVFDRIDRFVAAGGNGVVFDAKDIDGAVSFRTSQPLAAYSEGCLGPAIPELDRFVAQLHDRELWVVARIAVCLDRQLGRRRPDLALSDSLGVSWQERECVWLDPSQAEVQDYNLALARELASAGVNEVQIDYIRFPTNGWRGDWQGDRAATARRRRDVITGFVARLDRALGDLGCRLSADIFGIAAWDRTADLALTGQHVPSLAPYLDVICPMIYPSHFKPGFEGLAEPAAHPATVVTAGVRRCRELTGPDLIVRPWLQAFAWRVPAYDDRYVAVQIRAAEEAGASGWSLWNPSGRYDLANVALVAP